MYLRGGTWGEWPKCQRSWCLKGSGLIRSMWKSVYMLEKERWREEMLSCWRRGKKITCQQPTTESPIECCLDMGTKLFCSHPRVSRKEEIYSMLSLFTFLTKATRQELRIRSLPPTPEAEVHSPGPGSCAEDGTATCCYHATTCSQSRTTKGTCAEIWTAPCCKEVGKS